MEAADLVNIFKQLEIKVIIEANSRPERNKSQNLWSVTNNHRAGGGSSLGI